MVSSDFKNYLLNIKIKVMPFVLRVNRKTTSLSPSGNLPTLCSRATSLSPMTLKAYFFTKAISSAVVASGAESLNDGTAFRTLSSGVFRMLFFNGDIFDAVGYKSNNDTEE